MATLNASGLTIATQTEIADAIKAALRGEISDSLDLSSASPYGQLVAILARRIRLYEEALAALYAAQDPDSASGDALDRLCALSGVYREGATYTSVLAPCTLAAGTYPAGSLVLYPAGHPADRFANLNPVTSPGGSVSVLFRALAAGPVQISDSAPVVIVPVAGWTAVGAGSVQTIGTAEETDAALRLRRLAAIAAAGSGTVDGIRSDILRSVADVDTCTVIANPTSAVVDGIPAYGVEIIVSGAASDAAIGSAIWATVGAGTPLAGMSSVTVTDAEGYSHVVRFSRVADLGTTVSVTLVRSATGYAGDAAVRAVLEGLDLGPGVDLSWSAVVAAVMAVPGVLRVTAVVVDGVPYGTTEIGPRERAVIGAGDATVTSSIGVA